MEYDKRRKISDQYTIDRVIIASASLLLALYRGIHNEYGSKKVFKNNRPGNISLVVKYWCCGRTTAKHIFICRAWSHRWQCSVLRNGYRVASQFCAVSGGVPKTLAGIMLAQDCSRVKRMR